MTVDQYIFWSNIATICNNLDNLDAYKEAKWIENFSFKEKLDVDLKFVDNLLENIQFPQTKITKYREIGEK